MARTSQNIEVGRRKFELSNLTKVLYPDDGVLKAEIIEYYLKLAPTILQHLKGRPLTLIRFPDGIYGEQFYQKHRPDWAPDWLEFVELGRENLKEYILATEEASLVWLANLACLELHQMHCRKPNFEHPDYIVFDLDPPEDYKFYKVVDLALRLRDFLLPYGYTSFIKTTGGKGLHLQVPIEAKWSFNDAFDAAKDIADPFINENKNATLHIKKESRKGRILVDIYRNRQSQSIISAYSMRGREGAPVAYPLSWEVLEQMDDPKEFDYKTVMNLVLNEGDAWEGISAYAVPLHTKEAASKDTKDLPASPHYKTPEQLGKYSTKRDFEKTPEPSPVVSSDQGSNFVVHRHFASHLHYDLRLEQDGVLKSWAVPRGLPPRPGVKRLAVQTEDHPMKYLDFEGTIPKGLYGGGDMWVYARGKYEITKEKKTGFYFFLHSREVTAEFRIHLMKDKEWLLERVDTPQKDWVLKPPDFMLASAMREPPVGEDLIYEVKWDGIRAFVSVDEGKITLLSRNMNDITAQFPELTEIPKVLKVDAGLFDAEIVCLDKEGRPDFKKVIRRLQKSNEGDIERSSKTSPAYCFLFDCLYLDGRIISNEPLHRRRAWMKGIVKKDSPFKLSDILEDGPEFFEAARQLGLEGIMAKDRNSRYQPGKRSEDWIKVKVRQTTDCLILGYTKGKGDRAALFGALQIAEKVGKKLEYRGKVGSGFTEKSQKEVLEILESLPKAPDATEFELVDRDSTTLVAPILWCEVEYASMTSNKTFREPVFVRLRPDLGA